MKKKSKTMTQKELDDIADRPLTDKEWDEMGPWMHGIDSLPPELQKAVRRAIGRPKVAHPKEKVTVRFDHEVITALRAKGKGWQTELNALVRQAIAEKRL